MNTKRYLLAFATILMLHPSVTHAQPNSSNVREHTFSHPETPQRGPGVGFSFGMRPGPGNAYTYPYVTSIVSGSAADAAGLMAGDTIVSVDGRDIREGDFFPIKVAGTRYIILVRRGTEERELVYTYPQVAQSPRREN